MVKGQYNSDPFFKLVLENPKNYKNFVVKGELIFLSTEEKNTLCLPNVKHNGKGVRELVIEEAHSLLAHLGSKKTLTYIREHVWWKEMVNDVESFCKSCATCARSKPSNQKPYGLLSTLQPPARPWDSIGIDFVGPLPKSENRNGTFDMLTVIIDRMTGMVHLVPTREDFTAKNMAELVFDEVYKRHGLPLSIVSDRDKLFTSTFWDHLHKLIGTKLRMSSVYHPETDGITERANRTMTQMIRQCIGDKQRDWSTKVAAIEFAMNSARSETTGYAPFFLNYGRMPRPFVWNTPGSDEFPGVRAYANKVRNAIMAAHDSIIEARIKNTRAANRKRQPSPFVAGDLVYLSSKNIRFDKGLARKFLPKYIGPYRIIEDFGNNSYRLELPPKMVMRGIHNVFHASLLRVHHRNDDQLFPGRTESHIWEFPDKNQEQEFAVDKIIGHQGAAGDALFHLLWKDGEKSWLSYPKIKHLTVLSDYLDSMGAENITQLKRGDDPEEIRDEQVEFNKIFIDEEGGEDHINLSLASLRVHESPMNYHHTPYVVPPGTRCDGRTTKDPATNPIRANDVNNMVVLDRDEYQLTVVVEARQGYAYKCIIVAGTMLRQWVKTSHEVWTAVTSGTDPRRIMAPPGMLTFCDQFNSYSSRWRMPVPLPNGRWKVGDARNIVTKEVIDFDRIGTALFKDPVMEALGMVNPDGTFRREAAVEQLGRNNQLAETIMTMVRRQEIEFDKRDREEAERREQMKLLPAPVEVMRRASGSRSQQRAAAYREQQYTKTGGRGGRGGRHHSNRNERRRYSPYRGRGRSREAYDERDAMSESGYSRWSRSRDRHYYRSRSGSRMREDEDYDDRAPRERSASPQHRADFVNVRGRAAVESDASEADVESSVGDDVEMEDEEEVAVEGTNTGVIVNAAALSTLKINQGPGIITDDDAPATPRAINKGLPAQDGVGSDKAPDGERERTPVPGEDMQQKEKGAEADDLQGASAAKRAVKTKKTPTKRVGKAKEKGKAKAKEPAVVAEGAGDEADAEGEPDIDSVASAINNAIAVNTA